MGVLDLPLYRPGKEPLIADSPPIVYQYVKSCGHSAMAMYPMVVPYVDKPEDKSWIPQMQGYLDLHQRALATIKDLDVTNKERKLIQTILQGNVDFMQSTLDDGAVSMERLQAFAKTFKPLAEQAIAVAANAQVTHWMEVLDGWKKMMSDEEWGNLIAATNSIYVTRQNNILFSILAQYMGRDSVNRRLMLFETTSFTTTKEQMLSLVTRIVADRDLGELYFNDYYLMDFELLGSGARKVIVDESNARGMEVILPPMAPFNTIQWPWHTIPEDGSGPATLEDTSAVSLNSVP